MWSRAELITVLADAWESVEDNADPGRLPEDLFGYLADAVINTSRPIALRQVERLTGEIEAELEESDSMCDYLDTRDAAERSVAVVLVFFGLQAEDS